MPLEDFSDKAKRILILGGGFGGIYTAKYLKRFLKGGASARVVVLDKRNYFLFTPLLHEVATGGVSPENATEPFRSEALGYFDDFYLAEAKKIFLKKNRVETSLGAVDYDYLVIALGSQANFYGIEGSRDKSFVLKSLDDAIALKKRFIENFEKASKSERASDAEMLLSFVVVGGGPTGVELSAEMADFFYKTLARSHKNHNLVSKIKIILIERSGELIPNFSKPLRLKAAQILRNKKVDVLFNSSVQKVGKDFVELSGGGRIRAGTVIWVAGISPNKIRFDASPGKTPSGKLIVDKFLRLPGYEQVFALGDSVHFPLGSGDFSAPALAQVAVKEARLVAENISRAIKRRAPTEFFYRHSGDLISVGGWNAIAEIKNFYFPVYFSGRFAWWLWRTVYLFKMISFRKKVKVAVDWTINLFLPRDISKL